MQEVAFLQNLHQSTKRDYIARATMPHRAECMRIASMFGPEYWDGDRKYGYGGFHYDGRYRPVAEALAKHYGLTSEDTILDVGCGKGFLLHEFRHTTNYRCGIDISPYAIQEALNLNDKNMFPSMHSATHIPCPDRYFTFLYSINTLHNLCYKDLKTALAEITRVMRDKAWIVVESYRTLEQKVNLLNWALTCKSYYSTDDWINIFQDNGYSGDFEFVTFD